MSAWRLLVRELHEAGGSKPVHLLYSTPQSLETARQLGLVARTGTRGRSTWTGPATLTLFGADVADGRVQKVDARVGRRWQATWLAALPRENEVRLTSAVHPAQCSSTCYWYGVQIADDK